MNHNYTLVDRPPTFDEYRALCTAVGWAPLINFDAARASLPASLLAVVAVADSETVGMGRVVGDCAMYFYIQDVAVMPSHQRRGVGKRIIARLLERIELAAPPQAFVGLFAAEGTDSFYRRHGFITHPSLTGMFQTMPQRNR